MQSARDRWFEQLRIERERRRDAALMVDGRNPREAFIERLKLIGERLAADPDYEPLSPEELKESSRQIGILFRDLGYGRGK
jgi:hypothetical protein